MYYTALIIYNNLNVTIADLLEEQVSEYITEAEELIRAYRRLSPEKKRMLRVYMNMLLQYND